MPLLWLALAVSTGSIVAASIFATRKGLEAFRSFKALGRSTAAGLERIEVASAEIERHLARAAESGTRLDAELVRLRRSRARLHVLTGALDDVRASLGRVTAVYPRT